VGDLARAVEGTLLRGDPEAVLSTFSIDSRRLDPQSAFFALRGARDGHEFVSDAARHGALAAVVSREPGDDVTWTPALIRVEDTTTALARAGSWVRNRLGEAKFVAITGSTGKTTTKELLASALSARFRVHRSPGNLNNHLGVPLALLACPRDSQVVVLELGMSGPGEIAALTRICRPHVALVTNIRPAHLASFRDLDDIAAAKGELFAVLDPAAVAVVNLDDPHVRLQSYRHEGPRVTFGRAPNADFRLDHVEDRFLPGASFRFRHGAEAHQVRLRIGGSHAAYNALAAVAAAFATGENPADAIGGLESVQPGPGRGRVHHMKDDVHLLDDSYNSNPAAMASVLETLRHENPTGRKVLVMGDMLELGSRQKTFHHDIGRKAASAGVDVMIGVGPLTRHALESARRSGVREVHHEKDAAGAAAFVADLLRPGDFVVVKGSRGVGLDRVVEELLRRAREGR